MDTAKTIQALKTYFKNCPPVAAALLFGSRARGESGSRSDWDVAVYFEPADRDSAEAIDLENKIWVQVSGLIKSEVDLVVLNQAPPLLAYSILRRSQLLFARDRRFYLNRLMFLFNEAIDFRDFVFDFYAIKQRAASLAPEDRVRLIQILDFLNEEIKDFALFSQLSQQQYEQDKQQRRAAERWAENLINGALDSAKIILASEKRPLPVTYQDALAALGNTPYFSQEFAQAFSQWARLRNLLAHQYLDIRWQQLSLFIQRGATDFNELVTGIKKALA